MFLVFVWVFAVCLVNWTTAVNDYNYCQAPLPDYKLINDIDNSYELTKIQIIHRHGSRLPLYTLPCENEDWNQIKCFNAKFFKNRGDYYSLHVSDPEQTTSQPQLLNEDGYKQLKELGQRFQTIYQSFISPKYNTNYISIRSSNILRTITSAQGLITGWFPENSSEIIIKTVPLAEETMFPPESSCSLLSVLNYAFRTSDSFQAKLHEHPALEDELWAAFPVCSKWKLYQFFDNFSCRKCLNLDFCFGTECADNNLVERVLKSYREMWEHEYEHTAHRDDIHRLRIGRFLSEILDDMLDSNLETKLYTYSGHDATLALLHSALMTGEYEWPPYASYIVLETYEKNEEKYIRFIYNNEVIPLQWCAVDAYGLCKREDFTSKLQVLIPDNHTEECQIKTDL